MALISAAPRVRSNAENALLGMLLFVGFAVNIYFVSPDLGGVPLRFIYMLAMLGFLFLLAESVGLRCLMRARTPIALICYLGAIGFVLAAFRDGAGAALSELIANHVQAIVMLVVAMMGTALLGQRAMTIALVAAIGISLLFSVLQALGLEPASAVRDYLGTYHFDKASDADLMESRFPGLSYSSIVLGNQACLAFALLTYGAFTGFGRAAGSNRSPSSFTRRWLLIGIWAAALFVASLVQGNRSPILGLAIFVGLAISARRPQLLILAVPVLVAVYFAIDPIRELLSHGGYRVAATGDKSQMARNPLLIYGWRLFLANPLGYGITFDSKLLSSTVNTGDLVAQLNGAYLNGIFEDRDLHDYWITMLDIYGVFVVPAAMFLLYAIVRYWTVALVFVPYIVHITFHNIAPFFGDYMFWAALGIIMASETRRGRGPYWLRFGRMSPASSAPAGREAATGVSRDGIGGAAGVSA